MCRRSKQTSHQRWSIEGTCACVISCFRHVWHFATVWTVARQALLSMRFSRQEYWSGLTCPPPGDLPNPGIARASPGSLALAGGFFTTESPGKPADYSGNLYFISSQMFCASFSFFFKFLTADIMMLLLLWLITNFCRKHFLARPYDCIWVLTYLPNFSIKK